jgi:GNAT superfamily N-acetyltransferase
MASRAERVGTPALAGPEPIAVADIGELNILFSDAFTERYRRDGLVGVRVPPLNPAIWRYAIEGAGAGAMLWRDAAGAIAAFNIAHASGAEGWMGPLAVRQDCQGAGQGKAVVRAAIAHLRATGCRTIGLETMPRTVDNIGFYAGLGFVPGHLTVTLTIEASAASSVHGVLSALHTMAREAAVAECAALASRLAPGADYSREIRLTHDLALGDTLVVRRGDAIVGFALCHAAPLVEGRSRDELRVLKLVAADLEAFRAMLPALAALARRSANNRVALRMQGEYRAAFADVVAAGGRVRWTDLRMTLDGYPQVMPASGVLLSNWEI